MARLRTRHDGPSLIQISLVLGWVIFTVSLVGWWIYFGTTQIDRLISVAHLDADVVRYQKMLLWEGITMVVSLVGGAAALFYYIYREHTEGKKMREFFAAFTHEIKTPLASARLKGEILKERISDNHNRELIDKLLTDVNRLSLQLENSLYLADSTAKELYLEKLSIQQVVSSLRDLWPALSIDIWSDEQIVADKRMIETILANLFQNALVHGKATEVTVETAKISSGYLLTIKDNGSGFSGHRQKLGVLFSRHYSGSGSGIGLHLVKTLVERMGGTVEFPDHTGGFCVKIYIHEKNIAR